MANVSIAIDERQLDRIKAKLHSLDQKSQDKIFKAALRRAGTAARAEMSKQIRAKYTIAASTAKGDMRLIFQGVNAACSPKPYLCPHYHLIFPKYKPV
jgi:hypothetical protein